jgi:hypothetical protein
MGVKEAHINDLSLSGQFEEFRQFRKTLDAILAFRLRNPSLASKIYCSKSLSARLVTKDQDLQRCILNTRDRNYIGLVLNWLTKSGPFWDDERFFNADDLFYFQDIDVTDQGLGEATRRVIVGIEACSLSFLDDVGTFAQTPLNVTHGLLEQPIGTVAMPNFWQIDTLPEVLQSAPESWEQAVSVWADSYKDLIFASNLLEPLKRVPFDVRVADGIYDTLRILQILVSETQPDGSFTQVGMNAWQKYTVGDRPKITDESDDNKIRFKQDLTFKDPQDTQQTLFCTWHGKIKLNQFRIHFEWPRPKGQKSVKVVFIGPKITKK